MATVVLAHSPLTGPAAWGGLPGVLAAAGHQPVVLDVRDDDTPPYAGRWVARAALQVAAAAPREPLVLVGHSGAGYLLPALGSAQRAARRRVRGYVFLDAGLPQPRPASRLDLMRAEDPTAAVELEQLLAAGGVFPTWSAEDLRDLVPDDPTRAALVASLRPRRAPFFAESLPVAPDWPDAPCGYVRHSPAYARPARTAAARGWPVVDREAGHFAAAADPEAVAGDLADLLGRL